MTAWLLALLTLIPSSLRAQERRGPRCPDGKAPFFTGVPFAPLSCAKQPPASEVQLSSTSLPAIKGARLDLDDLEGAWETILPRGPEHYQILLVISKASKGYTARLELQNLTTLQRHVFDAELKTRFFGGKGRYDGVVRLAELPDPHDATLFVGAPYSPDKDGLEREVVLVYARRADSHRVRFTPAKDAVRFRYDYPGAPSMTGELRRSQRKPL